MLRWMRLARRLGERIGEAAAGEGAGPNIADVGAAVRADVGLGREALLVGACLHAREDDVLAPAPGDLAVYLMRGIAPGAIVAQYLGRAAGPSRGRDGRGSIGDAGRRLIAPVSELVSSVSVAAGAALALARSGEDAIALCFFGERASCRGDWHEGMNFAAVQRLPVVYVCASAPDDSRTRAGSGVERVAERAVAYGIPGVTIDGADPLEAYEAVGDAVARARRGDGPSLIEGWTRRAARAARGERDRGGPSEPGRPVGGGDGTFVPNRRGEPARGSGSDATRGVGGELPRGEAIGRPGRMPQAPADPVERFARELVRERLLDTAALAGMDASIEEEVARAFAWAEAQPQPEADDLHGGLYASGADR